MTQKQEGTFYSYADEAEAEAALQATSQEAENFRYFLEKKLEISTLDSIWAVAIAMRCLPMICEDNPQMLIDLRAVLAKKNSVHQKAEQCENN